MRVLILGQGNGAHMLTEDGFVGSRPEMALQNNLVLNVAHRRIEEISESQ